MKITLECDAELEWLLELDQVQNVTLQDCITYTPKWKIDLNDERHLSKLSEISKTWQQVVQWKSSVKGNNGSNNRRKTN